MSKYIPSSSLLSSSTMSLPSSSSSSSSTSSLSLPNHDYTLHKRPSGKATNTFEYMDFLNRNRNYVCFIDDIPSIFTLDDVRTWTMSYGSVLDVFSLGKTSVQNYAVGSEGNNDTDHYETWAAGVKFYSQQAASAAKRGLHDKKPWEQYEFASLYFPTDVLVSQSSLLQPLMTTAESLPELPQFLPMEQPAPSNTEIAIATTLIPASSSSVVSKDTSGNSLLSTSSTDVETGPSTDPGLPLPPMPASSSSSTLLPILPPFSTDHSNSCFHHHSSPEILPSTCIIQTSYLPLRAWIGKPLRIDQQRDEHYEPLASSEIIDMLNRYAPLQWSNSIEMCDIYRRCKKKEAPKPLNRIEALLEDKSLTTEQRLELIQQMFPSLTVPIIHLSSSSSSTTTEDNGSHTVPSPFSTNILSSVGSSSMDALAIMNGMMDEEDAYDDDAQDSFDGFSSITSSSTARALKPIHPRTLAREALIHENVQNNLSLGCTSLNDIANKQHVGHTLRNPMNPLRPVPLIDGKFITLPSSHKPGTFTRPCVFVRQSVIFHNKDGTDVTSTAAGGCGCRHRDDGLATSTTRIERSTNCGEPDGNTDLRHDHIKMYIVPPPAKPINPSVQITAPMVALNSNSIASTAPLMPFTVPVAYENYDDSLLPLSQQLSQPTEPSVVPVSSSSSSSPSTLVSTLFAAIHQAKTSAATSSASSTVSDTENTHPNDEPPSKIHRLRLRGSQKRQPWTASDIAMGKPIKYASTEAFRMATARLCLKLSKPSVGSPPPPTSVVPVIDGATNVQTSKKRKRSF